MLMIGVQMAAAQAPDPSAFQFADRAYQELAQANYPAAIEDFNRALAKEPANWTWRKELAYTYARVELLKDAAREFQTVYRDNPGDLILALELGYISQKLHDEQASEGYFKDAAGSTDRKISDPARAALANLQAARVQARKKQAYDVLAQNRRAEAQRFFEQLHEIDPSDGATTLQLGYIYLASGDNRKARAMFAAERESRDPQVAARAKEAMEEVERRTKWWFGNVYAGPSYQSRFANGLNVANGKIGLSPSPYFEPYLGVRFTRDTRSTAGILPEIYSDNSATFSVGIQTLIPGSGISLYGEAGTALRLLDAPNTKHAAPDYRAGVTWFQDWGTTMAAASHSHSSGLGLTGSAYSDVSFYSRYNRNFIGYVQLRQGLSLPTAHVLPVQLLTAVNFVKDSNREFYNNVLEAGPALRIAPFHQAVGLQLEAQYLRGFYTLHSNANPYGAHYRDFRFLMMWGKSFGRR
jgi:tetratricopeptide (TPR) repeat protein